MRSRKILLIAALLALVVAFFGFDLDRYLDLSWIQDQQAALSALHARRPLAFIGAFFALYVAVTAVSLPGATVLTLAAGAVFGLLEGTLIVSFASSIGATLAFLVARHLLRDSVRARLGARLREIDAGIARDGAFYLFALRLVPLFPFFVINLLMGLTRMKTGVFYLVSQVGMLAGTLVYVNAGRELARIDSARDILSPGLLASFALLGVFPLLAKKLVELQQGRRVYARWPGAKPRRFDRNLVVIGAGAAGLVASYVAATVRAKVTLVESHRMGGDCLNYGCVPSKALIRSATLVRQMKDPARYGIAGADARFSFADVMERIARIVREIEPHDSIERYTALGVDVVQGHARLVDPWTVTIERPDGATQTLTTRSIVIATGARPLVPPLPGIERVDCLTSDTLWGLRELPARLLVLGGGPVGCELAQAFARLGSQVTQVEVAERVLGREDAEVSAFAQQALEADGVRVLTRHRALRFEVDGQGQAERRFAIVEAGGAEQRIEFDRVLCAVGRVARLEGYGLESLGIETHRTVTTDAYLRTRYPNILAAGDVAGPWQFTHAAAHQSWHAAVNALFGRFWRFKVDDSAMPQATFLDPEIARVGLNEREATAHGVAFEVTRFALAELDRAIVDSATDGFVKVLTVPGKDRILGVTIVGAHASEWIAEYVLAMRHGLGLNKILSTIHIYPTFAEANKYAAGAWKRRHAPERVLTWLARFHAWQRG